MVEDELNTKDESKQELKRDEWLSLPTMNFLTDSQLDRRKEREKNKRTEKEKGIYNPRENSREINPFWKDGGDGMPKFKKPSDESEEYIAYNRNYFNSINEQKNKSFHKNRENTKRYERSYENKDDYKYERSYKRKENYSSERDNKSTEDKYEKDYKNKIEYKSDCKYVNRNNSSYVNRTSNWRKKTVSQAPESTSTDSKPKEDKHGLIYENLNEDIKAKENESSSKILSDKEMNTLAAKLVKAEIMGNTKLIAELKTKLENARKIRENKSPESRGKTEEVLLTRTDSKGFSKPVTAQSDYMEPSRSKKKKQKVETHKGGERIRYFADDDKYSLKQMFENEKFSSIEDQNNQFIQMAGKVKNHSDMDDIFTDNIRKKNSVEKVDKINRDKAVNEHKKISESLDNCNKCIQSDHMPKNLMVSMGEAMYLSLPAFEPLTEGHCCIIPIRHVPCATQLDENEWSELLDYRKAVVKMFQSRDEDVIFFETAMYLNRFPHMSLECIPMPKEQGDLAPIYFKKAIDESETEWASNKKLISLSGKDVRKCVPKGLPYFSVSFGMQEGYAHVIEDQKYFPNNFAQEIIGGMLDLHHSKWRKPKRQSFDEQSKRILEFSKMWKPFDCGSKY